MDGTSTSPAFAGRVLQVNVSPGGVPKHPVASAHVGDLGLDGDRHRNDTVHGGPHRAVALLGIEAIRRVADEGHPIEPGSVGENLTTEGIEWSLLPAGTRAAIGPDVVLEISMQADPCDTIKDSFHDGRSGRISILRHPADSRMYARVIAHGTVRPNDAIRLLPPAPDSLAETHRLLHRLESVEADAYLNLWHSLAATGARISIVDDGDWCGATCAAIPSSAFNRTLGYRLLPNLLERMLDVYRRSGTPGWIVGDADSPPWPGAVAMEGGSDVFHAMLAAFVAPPHVDGVTVRAIGPDEASTWAEVIVAGFGTEEPEAGAWRDLAPYLIRAPGEHFVVAERDGRSVGAAALFTRRKVGLMAAATVLPEERGRGIQAALLAERVRIAGAAGCEWLMATAATDGPSARNLEGLGFSRVWRRSLWRFDPALA